MPFQESGGGIGSLMHIAGSFFIVYGQTIVKVTHCIVESSKAGNTWMLPSGSQFSWRRPDGRWKRLYVGPKVYGLCGWLLFAAGNLLRFVSMRFASQTVLSGLGSLQFVVIPMASKQWLGVKPDVSTGIGVGVVLLGNVLILMHGPPEVGFSPQELREQWSTPDMKRFLFGIGLTMGLLHVLWRWIHHRRRMAEAAQRTSAQRLRRKSREQLSVDGKDLFPGSTAIWDIPGSHEMDLIEDSGDPNTLRMFTAALLFSAVSSFVGAWSVLFSKSLTYIVGSMPESLYDWYTWVIVLGFLVSAGFWIRQSDKGLKLYPATLIMPLMQAFWLGMSVLQGMIYFDEMQSLSRSSLLYLTVGLILAIFGAVAMGLSGYFNEHKMQQQISRSNDIEAPHLHGMDSDVLQSPIFPQGKTSVASSNSLSDLLQEQVGVRLARKGSNMFVHSMIKTPE
jgi:hypothetical protein